MKVSIELDVPKDEIPLITDLFRTLKGLAHAVGLKEAGPFFRDSIQRLRHPAELDMVAADISAVLGPPITEASTTAEKEKQSRVLEELTAAFTGIVFDSSQLPTVDGKPSTLPFMNLLPKLPEVARSKMSKVFTSTVLKKFKESRPVTANRGELYHYADAFACLVLLDFFTVHGALTVVNKLLPRTEYQSSVITALARTVELCLHKVWDNWDAEDMKALADNLERVNPVFSYDVEYIKTTLGLAPPPQHPLPAGAPQAPPRAAPPPQGASHALPGGGLGPQGYAQQSPPSVSSAVGLGQGAQPPVPPGYAYNALTSDGLPTAGPMPYQPLPSATGAPYAHQPSSAPQGPLPSAAPSSGAPYAHHSTEDLTRALQQQYPHHTVAVLDQPPVHRQDTSVGAQQGPGRGSPSTAAPPQHLPPPRLQPAPSQPLPEQGRDQPKGVPQANGVSQASWGRDLAESQQRQGVPQGQSGEQSVESQAQSPSAPDDSCLGRPDGAPSAQQGARNARRSPPAAPSGLKALDSFGGHSNIIFQLAYDSTRGRVSSISRDGTMKWWTLDGQVTQSIDFSPLYCLGMDVVPHHRSAFAACTPMDSGSGTGPCMVHLGETEGHWAEQGRLNPHHDRVFTCVKALCSGWDLGFATGESIRGSDAGGAPAGSAGHRSLVCFYDVRPGQSVASLSPTVTYQEHQGTVVCLSSFEDRPHFLASASMDSTVRTFDRRTPQSTGHLRVHDGVVTCLDSFGPHYLLSGSSSGHTRLWDLRSFSSSGICSPVHQVQADVTPVSRLAVGSSLSTVAVSHMTGLFLVGLSTSSHQPPSAVRAGAFDDGRTQGFYRGLQWLPDLNLLLAAGQDMRIDKYALL